MSTATGEPVPSRFADDAELAALVDACGGRTWQINVETKFGLDAAALNAEVDRYAEWSRAAGARLTWSPFHADATEAYFGEVLRHNAALNTSGVLVSPQVSALAIAVLLRFDEPSFLVRIGGWEAVLSNLFDVGPEARKARLADPALRDALETG